MGSYRRRRQYEGQKRKLISFQNSFFQKSSSCDLKGDFAPARERLKNILRG